MMLRSQKQQVLSDVPGSVVLWTDSPGRMVQFPIGLMVEKIPSPGHRICRENPFLTCRTYLDPYPQD